MANKVLAQLQMENADMFKQVNVGRNQFAKKDSPIVKQRPQEYNRISNSRGKTDNRPPIANRNAVVSSPRGVPKGGKKDTDILSMMANRLTKLEFENKELKEQLAAKTA